MDTKSLLGKAIAVTSFLFAAFGQFLLNIAPPDEGGVRFAVGLASFFSLGILLFLSGVARGLPPDRYKRRWLTASGIALLLALVASLFYYNNFERSTFRFPTANSEDIYFRGTELTDEASQYVEANPGSSVQDMVRSLGGLPALTAVWPEASTTSAKIWLTVHYMLLVLSLATGIFCLTEGILGGGARGIYGREEQSSSESPVSGGAKEESE